MRRSGHTSRARTVSARRCGARWRRECVRGLNFVRSPSSGRWPQLGPCSGRPEMALHVVKVPDIGEGIAEVELVEWRVRPGDMVVADQPLADVMTDKATVEVPSPVAGKV